MRFGPRKETQNERGRGAKLLIAAENERKKYPELCFFPLRFVLLQKMKEANLDEWKNIRGPRPWEDSREYQEQQRSRQRGKES